MKILIGVTGSVATVKLPLLVEALAGHEVRRQRRGTQFKDFKRTKINSTDQGLTL
jgi:hypothetical protein